MDIQAQVLEILKQNQQFQQQNLQFQQQNQQFQQKLAEMQIQSDKKLDLIAKIVDKNLQSSDDDNTFTQGAVWSAIETFKYRPNEDISFEAYFRRYEDLYINDCRNWTDAKKVRLLTRKLDTAEHTRFVNYILPRKTNELTFQETVKLLTELFSPKTSLFHKRWKCLNLVREENEEFTVFAAKVNKSCDDFKLSELSADNFKCLVFCQGLISANDAEVRRRVLNKLECEPNLTLQQLAEDCQRYVTIKKDSKNIEESGVAHIRKVHFTKKKFSPPSIRRSKLERTESSPKKQNRLPPSPCVRCGALHWSTDCDYRKRKCFNCNQLGHKSSHCRKKSSSYVKTTKWDKHNENNIRKFVPVQILGKNLKLQLDSGSDLTIINLQSWRKIGRPTMLKTTKIARSVTGDKIKFEGEIIVNVTLNNKTKKMKLFVLKNTNNLFGSDAIQEFELWNSPINTFCKKVEQSTADSNKLLEELKESFPDVFSGGLGRCNKMTAKLELKTDSQPVFKKKRNIPFASLNQIDKELDRLEKTGVISKIQYSKWAAPAVYVRKKSNEIRVCADFSTGLNAALKDFNYPLPNPSEVFTKLNQGVYFSKIDLSDAYLQIPMEEDSSKLLCINTHRGLYKFERLPFGVKIAPSLFQQVMDAMLGGLDFTIAYLDDILIKSRSKEEHRLHVNQVFKRIQDYGFKIKESKCEFFLESIKYLGHIIDKNGRKPDPERSTAIKEMPAPNNIASLQSFLGLASYYQSFIPKMQDLRAPLNELLKKDKTWCWTTECQEAFNKIKEVLTSDLFLIHFDPKLDLIVACDASSYGIGACILHKMPDGTNKPIAYASRTLLPSEKNYSQIEKEALGIIFAVTKFHRYLHGRHFLLQTDHKPLLTIFGSKKGLSTHTANRLQRWGTILLNYDFKMEFLPSQKISHADGLSRLIPKMREPLEDTVIASLRTERDINNVLCNTVRELPVTLEEIKREALKDEFIRQTKERLENEDQQVTNAYTLCDGVLLYRDRVVVPATLQSRILKDFHVGHPGITRTKSLMRSFVFWKNLDKDIENMVKTCTGCARAAKSPPVKFSPWPKTDRPWTRIHADFAGPVDGHYYLIVVDSFSKWPEVFKCKKPTSEVAISALHELFARFGVVDCIVSDNGTQFTSSDFKEFCEDFQVNHITTPPYHPRSNGLAERFVDTLKRALKKAKGTPTDKALQQFLQVYRITPNRNTPAELPPAQIMFAREVRSVFSKLLPRQIKPCRNQTASKRYVPGEKIYFKVYKQNKTFWELGTIKKRIGNMVYIIDGPKFSHKRHTNQLRKRWSDDINSGPPENEDTMDVIYDTFDLPSPQQASERRRSLRKRKTTEFLNLNPKKRKY